MKLIRKLFFSIVIIFMFYTFVSCNRDVDKGLNASLSATVTATAITTPTATAAPTDISDEQEMQRLKGFGKLTDDIMSNSKMITDPKSWINSTEPKNEATIDPSSNISISFKYDMDEKSLNSENIIVYESKHSRVISNLFNYVYNKQNKTLNINFKIPDNNYGTGNGILVFVLGDVKNTQNESMGINVKFGFSTK